MYIVTLYTHITFSTYGDIFIILNKKIVLGLNVFHLLDLFKFIGLYYLF